MSFVSQHGVTAPVAATGVATGLLLSGNEAVAQAAADAGVHLATGYPGAPAVEIIEELQVRLGQRKAFWHTNEKTALEMGIGAALHDEARVLVAMKHVGLNVAADAFKSAAITGLNGSLVLVVCDDPGMHSSQNEFDSRRYAAETGTVVLEPADAQEAYDLTRDAFSMAADLGSMVMLRMTTRVCHSQSRLIASPADTRSSRVKPLSHNPSKYVVAPAFSKPNVRRLFGVELPARRQRSEQHSANWCQGPPRARRGIIVTGVVYHYLAEVLEGTDVRLLKLGMPLPFPRKLVQSFAASVDELYVFEEGRTVHDELLASQLSSVRSAPLAFGEWSPEAVRRALDASAQKHVDAPKNASAPTTSPAGLPVVIPAADKPATLCPGCPHRGMSFAVKQLGIPLIGDIGCSTLAAFPPLDVMSTALEMGASIPMAEGSHHICPDTKPVCMIGDGSFLHSGIPGLIAAVENNARITVLIMDNDGIAMTGQQATASSRGRQVDLEALVASIGVRDIQTVDAHDIAGCSASLRRSQTEEGVSVIVVRDPCVLNHPRLKTDETLGPRLEVDTSRCTQCGQCLELGCPSITLSDKTGKPEIDDTCTGCGDCIQVCHPCPVQTRVQQFVAAFDHQQLANGAERLYDSNPFAGVCGSLCEGHCQTSAIVHREGPEKGRPREHARRFAEIEARLASYRPSRRPQQARTAAAPRSSWRVAVVGAGPAGLTAARELAAAGCQVQILEAAGSAGGGMVELAVGGAVRHERTLDDIQRILDLANVRIHYSARLGTDYELRELSREYDAAVIACGLDSLNSPVVRSELEQQGLTLGQIGLRNGNGSRLVDNLFAAGDILGDQKMDLPHAVASGKRAGREVVDWLQRCHRPAVAVSPEIDEPANVDLRDDAYFERGCDTLIGSVGGQGGVTTARILAHVFHLGGWACKTSETRGLAQRGGPVTVHVRGQRAAVHSPLIEQGRADVGLFLDVGQALKWQHWVADGGVVLVAAVDPFARHEGERDAQDIVQEIRRARPHLAVRQIGLRPDLAPDPTMGPFLLGYLSRWLIWPDRLWRTALEQVSASAASHAAFERGATLR